MRSSFHDCKAVEHIGTITLRLAGIDPSQDKAESDPNTKQSTSEKLSDCSPCHHGVRQVQAVISSRK